MQMLYHINVGHPMLVPGARLIAAVKSVVPHDRYEDPLGTAGYRTYPRIGDVPPQQSYFFELLADSEGVTRVLLEHPTGEQGLQLRFNKQQLPWFTLWRNNVAAADGYVTALEPGTNFPNPRPFEEQQ